jgi:hypothetical protein
MDSQIAELYIAAISASGPHAAAPSTLAGLPYDLKARRLRRM